jgi:type II secretory pathway component GspD/PulD (secretin)
MTDPRTVVDMLRMRYQREVNIVSRMQTASACSGNAMKLSRVGVVAAAFLFAAAFVGSGGRADGEPATGGWRDKPYPYTVVSQSLADVLTNFGYNTGMRMAVASSVRGSVTGRIDGRTAGAFLDVLTRSNGLDWYYDGSVMYVSAAADEQTEIVQLHEQALGAVKASLLKSGLVDERYTFSAGPSPNVAVIAGPPSYVAAIKRAVEAMATKSADSSLTIYRGSESHVVKFP